MTTQNKTNNANHKPKDNVLLSIDGHSIMEQGKVYMATRIDNPESIISEILHLWEGDLFTPKLVVTNKEPDAITPDEMEMLTRVKNTPLTTKEYIKRYGSPFA